MSYLWTLGTSQKQMASQIQGLSSKTTVDWSNFCRELVEEAMIKETEAGKQIGGPTLLSRLTSPSSQNGNITGGMGIWRTREG